MSYSSCLASLCCAGIVITSLPAHAQSAAVMPSLERHEPALDTVVNATRSALVADRSRAGGAYVLPPEAGLVTLQDVTLGSTVELCAEMRALQLTARELSARMAAFALDLGPLESELALLQTQRAEAEDRIAEFSDYPMLFDAADELALDLSDVAFRRDQLQQQFCTDTCPDEVASELADLAVQQQALESEQSALEAQATTREAEYRRAVADRDAFDSQIGAREDAYFAQLDQLQQLRQSILDMYDVYARTAGGSANILYDSGWRAAVARLQRDNPGLWFEPLPTRAARVHASMIAGIGTDAYLASNPAVLDYLVNGVSVALDAPPPELAAYPDAVQAQARLSLVSACVVNDPAAYDVEKAASGVPLFGLTVSYEYPVVAPVEVEVRYNLWSLRLLATSRYLGTRALGELRERAAKSGAVVFGWDPQDATVPPERQAAFELRVLWQLLQQLWAMTRTPIYDADSVRVYGGPSVPSTGMATIAARSGGLAIRSISGDARYTNVLNEVSLDGTLTNGRRVIGAVALGQLGDRVLPVGAVAVPLDLQADQLIGVLQARLPPLLDAPADTLVAGVSQLPPLLNAPTGQRVEGSRPRQPQLPPLLDAPTGQRVEGLQPRQSQLPVLLEGLDDPLQPRVAVARGASSTAMPSATLQTTPLAPRAALRGPIDAVPTLPPPMRVPMPPRPAPAPPRPKLDEQALIFQSISVATNLTADETRIVANSLSLARRAVDRTCGWYHLTCDGLSWVARPGLSESLLQAQLDQLRVERYSRTTVTYRTGATVFNP